MPTSDQVVRELAQIIAVFTGFTVDIRKFTKRRLIIRDIKFIRDAQGDPVPVVKAYNNPGGLFGTPDDHRRYRQGEFGILILPNPEMGFALLRREISRMIFAHRFSFIELLGGRISEKSGDGILGFRPPGPSRVKTQVYAKLLMSLLNKKFSTDWKPEDIIEDVLDD